MNKLYDIHACGKFNAGEVHHCTVVAPNESTARTYARLGIETFNTKILFAHETSACYDDLYMGSILEKSIFYLPCYKLPYEFGSEADYIVEFEAS